MSIYKVTDLLLSGRKDENVALALAEVDLKGEQEWQVGEGINKMSMRVNRNVYT